MLCRGVDILGLGFYSFVSGIRAYRALRFRDRNCLPTPRNKCFLPARVIWYSLGNRVRDMYIGWDANVRVICNFICPMAQLNVEESPEIKFCLWNDRSSNKVNVFKMMTPTANMSQLWCDIEKNMAFKPDSTVAWKYAELSTAPTSGGTC